MYSKNLVINEAIMTMCYMCTSYTSSTYMYVCLCVYMYMCVYIHTHSTHMHLLVVERGHATYTHAYVYTYMSIMTRACIRTLWLCALTRSFLSTVALYGVPYTSSTYEALFTTSFFSVSVDVVDADSESDPGPQKRMHVDPEGRCEQPSSEIASVHSLASQAGATSDDCNCVCVCVSVR
jgi:hypothetical protein